MVSKIVLIFDFNTSWKCRKGLNKIKKKFPETVLIKAGDFNPDDFNRYEAIDCASGIFTLNLQNRSISYLNESL